MRAANDNRVAAAFNATGNFAKLYLIDLLGINFPRPIMRVWLINNKISCILSN